MRRHVKASPAAPIKATGGRPAGLGLACLMVLGLVAFLGIGAPSARAVDTCPNVVFRTGPSAKLPDCRAYELVTPTFTGGSPPVAMDFGAILNGFDTSLITSAGDSVTFNTVNHPLSGFPATGVTDRYRAKRTADGWVTELIGPTAAQTPAPIPGGVAPDHSSYFLEAGGSNTEREQGTLQDPFGGEDADYIRTPSGAFELIGTGSLGIARRALGHWITANAGHVIFSTNTKLEPQAPPTGVGAVYDRTPGGPTHVVSLLPGDVTPTGTTSYLGTSKDGTDIAFEDGTASLGGGGSPGPVYVRHNNTTTEEVARLFGIVVGKKLTCSGEPSSATLAYQWLRNGAAIAGATSPSYTATAEDEGKLLQCRVTASNSEGTSVAVSRTWVVDPYQGTSPPEISSMPNVTGGVSTAEVGTLLSCENANFQGSPTRSYKWLRDGVEIGGATASTYTPVGADAGSSLQCRVAAANADGAAVAYSSNPVAIQPVVPKASVAPVIANVTDPGAAPQVGDELSCSSGTWSDSPGFTYRWLRDGTAIGGPSLSTYTVLVADEGKTLQCEVTAANGGGSTQAVADRVVVDPQPGTAPPQQTFAGGVFGTAQVGSTLFCGEGGWEGEPSFTYQWLRNGSPIAGATEGGYVLSAEDLETTIQCRLTATNAGGSTAAVDAAEGARYIGLVPPRAQANTPKAGITFLGVFGGNVFYSDRPTDSNSANGIQTPADLYSFNIATQTTTRITSVGDALSANVSEDGSRVYFVSEAQIGGQGTAGKPNFYVWSRADDSTTLVATVNEFDVTHNGTQEEPNLTKWYGAVARTKAFDIGAALSHTRSTVDGSILVFESTAQLTGFDNTEASFNDCRSKSEEAGLEPCNEVYRFDATSEALTCLSCGPAGVSPTGESHLQTVSANIQVPRPIGALNPVASLSKDGDTVVFETANGLVPQDGNEHQDVYRWIKGTGVALISTGQDLTDSYVYGVTPDASDIAFVTNQKLLPQDLNGGTARIYDARVGGGFPPPEETVREPCAGDVCQGAASAAPEPPNLASPSVNGQGNVATKLGCAKGKRRVIHKGNERCVRKRRHRNARHHHRRAHHKGRAAR